MGWKTQDLKITQHAKPHRSEGFPEQDIWFLGTLEQGSARCPELLGRRRRRRPPGGRPRPAGARRPPTPRKEFLQINTDIEVQ